MSDPLSDALDLKKRPDAATPLNSGESLRILVEESRAQTRHLRSIRWMLGLAWLVLLLGGVRIYLAK